MSEVPNTIIHVLVMLIIIFIALIIITTMWKALPSDFNSSKMESKLESVGCTMRNTDFNYNVVLNDIRLGITGGDEKQEYLLTLESENHIDMCTTVTKGTRELYEDVEPCRIRTEESAPAGRGEFNVQSSTIGGQKIMKLSFWKFNPSMVEYFKTGEDKKPYEVLELYADSYGGSSDIVLKAGDFKPTDNNAIPCIPSCEECGEGCTRTDCHSLIQCAYSQNFAPSCKSCRDVVCSNFNADECVAEGEACNINCEISNDPLKPECVERRILNGEIQSIFFEKIPESGLCKVSANVRNIGTNWIYGDMIKAEVQCKIRGTEYNTFTDIIVLDQEQYMIAISDVVCDAGEKITITLWNNCPGVSCDGEKIDAKEETVRCD